jgi:hypothetical protein
MLRRHILLTACAIAVPLASHAQPLGKEECDRLKADYTRLGQGDLKADLEKGAEWGRANLTEARLKEIQGFIELEEQFLFRCPQPRLVPLTAEAKAASAAPDAQPGTAGAAGADNEAAGASDEGAPAAGPSTLPADAAIKPPKPKKPSAAAVKPPATAKPASAAKAAQAAPAAASAKPAAPGAAATPSAPKPPVKVSKPDGTSAAPPSSTAPSP